VDLSKVHNAPVVRYDTLNADGGFETLNRIR
jgi:hypothetical protein